MISVIITIAYDIDFGGTFSFCKVSTISPAIRWLMPVVFDNVSTQSRINLWWVILETSAIVHIFCNQKLLKKGSIQKVDHSTKGHCNSGINKINQKGILQGVGHMWLNMNEITNIMSRA